MASTSFSLSISSRSSSRLQSICSVHGQMFILSHDSATERWNYRFRAIRNTASAQAGMTGIAGQNIFRDVAGFPMSDRGDSSYLQEPVHSRRGLIRKGNHLKKKTLSASSSSHLKLLIYAFAILGRSNLLPALCSADNLHRGGYDFKENYA